MSHLARLSLLVVLSAGLVVPAFASPTPSPELAELVETLAEEDAWDGARVGYAGVRTERRAAWERFATLASVDELLSLATEHPRPGVRYGAVRALVDRGADDKLPAWVMADDATVMTCPGGCICDSDTVGAYLRRIRDSQAG